MNLKKLGFKTGEIVLPGLGLETRLEPSHYFRDDGIVESLRKHFRKISEEFECPAIEEKCTSNNSLFSLGGESLQLESTSKKIAGFEKAAILFIKDHGYIENIFVKGHESTHALIFFGKQKEFTNYVHSQGFRLDPFKVFDHEEHIADIGGLVSLHRRGKDDYYRMPVPRFVLEAFLDSRNKKITSVYR
jgi:hypothetical protein